MGLTNYIFYKDYMKSRKLYNNGILISKVKKSYLIGPKINSKFDELSFYKRLKSTSLYDKKIYKNFSDRKVKRLIEKYIEMVKDNEVIEVFKDGTITIHKIIPLPRGKYEKK